MGLIMSLLTSDEKKYVPEMEMEEEKRGKGKGKERNRKRKRGNLNEENRKIG